MVSHVRKTFTKTLAVLGGSAHAIFFVCAYFLGVGGETAGWTIMLVDLPITVLLERLTGSDFVASAWLMYFVFGSAMYALFGMLMGYVIDRLGAACAK